MDIFAEKGIKPMLIGEQREAFDSQQYIYEIKLDGIRCIAYLDSAGTDLRNKRDKKLISHVPELADIHRQITGTCILDGELFVLKDGKTDFYEIQKRVMMTDPFKIRLAGARYPASFVAYDILYRNGELLTELPLMKRKELLDASFRENERISVSRYVESDGRRLFQLAKEQGLEGIVAKKKDSRYYFDKRTREWIKSKVMDTEDCVICGYLQKENNRTSLILGQYGENGLVYRGHVTLGVSLRALREHGYRKRDSAPFSEVPRGNEGAVWLEPELVCIVESMPTDKDSFRQPVFRGIRDDKEPRECY